MKKFFRRFMMKQSFDPRISSHQEKFTEFTSRYNEHLQKRNIQIALSITAIAIPVILSYTIVYQTFMYPLTLNPCKVAAIVFAMLACASHKELNRLKREACDLYRWYRDSKVLHPLKKEWYFTSDVSDAIIQVKSISSLN